MQILFLVFSFIIGACLGSFLCCSVRRLHLKTSSPKTAQKLGSRSVCLNCKTKLKWYDNLPIISWLFLKGKCRKCGKKIGIAELLAEIGTGLACLLITFSFSEIFCGWSNTVLFGQFPSTDSCSIGIVKISLYIISLILVLTLVFLAIYDGLYGELPTRYLITSIILALMIVALKFLNPSEVLNLSELILGSFFAVVILGGLYFLLYFVSKGKWVGDGDWLLGVAIGLALGSPWLALWVLFLSNILALLIMFPFLKGKNKKIPLGPFLVIAFVIVYSFSDFLLNML